MLVENSKDEKMQNPRYTAIFVDYENVYYHLRNKYADIPELSDFVVELLMNLQKHLEQESRTNCTALHLHEGVYHETSQTAVPAH